MQIRLKQIIAANDALKKLSTINLPIKISYRLRRLDDKVKSILGTYEEARVSLVKEYGQTQDDGTFSVSDPEKLKTFWEKTSELQEVEENIEFDKIKLEDMGSISIAPEALVEWIFDAE